MLFLDMAKRFRDIRSVRSPQFWVGIGIALAVSGILIAGAGVFYKQLQDDRTAVLAEQDQVEVSASLYGCELRITTRPQKRIPVSNNWGTQLGVEILAGSQSLGAYQTSSNSQGIASDNICDKGIQLTGGNYTLYVKGFSHLRRRFTNVASFDYYQTSLAFTSPTQILFSGETSVIDDNFINSLDISTQIAHIYTNDIKNDLNRDGVVNSLDFSSTIANFYMSGE